MSPGITGGGGSGRPRPTPIIHHFTCLIPKDQFDTTVTINKSTNKDAKDGEAVTLKYKPFLTKEATTSAKVELSTEHHQNPGTSGNKSSKDGKEIDLADLAWGRSGDKGDVANIGIIARDYASFQIISQYLTSQRVEEYMKHLIKGKIKRYELKGLMAFNFVCTKALGGGGVASLNIDRQGKTYAQILLDMKIPVSSSTKLPIVYQPSSSQTAPISKL